MLINDHAARIVDRHLTFQEGVAYGIDQLLEPPGLGAHCDTLENKTTYVSPASPRPGPIRGKGPTVVFDPDRPSSSRLRDAVALAKDLHRAPSDTTTRYEPLRPQTAACFTLHRLPECVCGRQLSVLRSCRESWTLAPPAPVAGAASSPTDIRAIATTRTAAGGFAAGLSGSRSAAETTMVETVKVRRRAGRCTWRAGRCTWRAGGCTWRSQRGATNRPTRAPPLQRSGSPVQL